MRVCTCVHVHVHMHRFPSSVHSKGTSSNKHTEPPSITLSTKRQQVSVERWLMPGLGQGKQQMSLSLLFQKTQSAKKQVGACHRTQQPAWGFPQSHLGQFEHEQHSIQSLIKNHQMLEFVNAYRQYHVSHGREGSCCDRGLLGAAGGLRQPPAAVCNCHSQEKQQTPGPTETLTRTRNLLSCMSPHRLLTRCQGQNHSPHTALGGQGQ